MRESFVNEVAKHKGRSAHHVSARPRVTTCSPLFTKDVGEPGSRQQTLSCAALGRELRQTGISAPRGKRNCLCFFLFFFWCAGGLEPGGERGRRRLGRMRRQGAESRMTSSVKAKRERKCEGRGIGGETGVTCVCASPAAGVFKRMERKAAGGVAETPQKRKTPQFFHISPQKEEMKTEGKKRGGKYIAPERQASSSTTCFEKRGPYIRKET